MSDHEGIFACEMNMHTHSSDSFRDSDYSHAARPASSVRQAWGHGTRRWDGGRVSNTRTVVISRRAAAVPSAVWNWQALALAVVASMSVAQPGLALRVGALICAVILVTTRAAYRPQIADLLALCLAILTLLSTLWTVSPEDTNLAVKNQLAVATIFLAVRAVALDRRGVVVILMGYLAGCGITLVKQIQGGGVVALYGAVPDRYGIEGLAVNYTAYSLATAVALVVILWHLSSAPTGRLVLMATAGALCIGVLATGSRGTGLSLLGLGVWIACSRFEPRRRLVVLYGVVTALALGILNGYLDQLILPYLNHTLRETGTLNGRLYMWPYARRILADNLLIGTGAQTFRALNPLGVYAHNALLELGTGLGIIGMCLFVATLVTALITGTRAMDARSRALLVGSMVVVSTPIFLSGVWDQSPAAWVAIGLFSRITVLAPTAEQFGLEPMRRELPR